MNDIARFASQIIHYNNGLHIRRSAVPCHGRILHWKWDMARSLPKRCRWVSSSTVWLLQCWRSAPYTL